MFDFFSTNNELTSQYIRTELLGKSHPIAKRVRTGSVLSGGLNRFKHELSDLDITNYAYNALSSGDHRPVPIPFPVHPLDVSKQIGSSVKISVLFETIHNNKTRTYLQLPNN